MRQAIIEVYPGRNGGFRWRVLGGNGEPMAASEHYPTRQHAQRGAEALIQAIVDARLVQRRTTPVNAPD